MKIEIHPDIMNMDSLIIRITEYQLERYVPQAFQAEMENAIKHYIATNAECQILINQMVVDAFKSVNLLELVTETIKAKVQELNVPIEKSGNS